MATTVQAPAAGAEASVDVAPGLPATTTKTPIAVGNRGFALTTFDEVWRFANILSKTEMAPKPYRGKADDAFIAIQFGMELGLSPMQAVQNIAPINGKPSIYGPLGLALVEASGLLTDKQGTYEGTPYEDGYKYVFMTQRGGRTPHVTEFSVADAKKAGLWNKEGPWRTYPKAMLMWRAVWPNLNFNFPDVLRGVGSHEIEQDAIEISAIPAGDPSPGSAAPDPLQGRIAAVKDAMHGISNGERPAAGDAIEVTAGKPSAPTAEALFEELKAARDADLADRAKQFEFIANLCVEIDALSPGASSGVLLALGGTTPQDELTGEQIADIQEKLGAVRDQLAAKAAPAGDAETATDEPAATDAGAQPAAAEAPAAVPAEESAEDRAAAIGRVNALVDQIDQVRDGAGGTALHDFLGTMDLDAVPLDRLQATEAHLTTALATVKPKQAPKDGKAGKADSNGQRSMPGL